MRIHADPDPGQTFTSQKFGFWYEKYTLCRKYVIINIPTKEQQPRLEMRFVFLLVFCQFSCSWIQINADSMLNVPPVA
jgi:hypothetical protein